MRLAAGIDGIRNGWLCVIFDIDAVTVANLLLINAVDDLLTLHDKPVIMGIDIPIGLLDHSRRGGRDCDRAARQLLGAPRQSSVFPPPVRSALDAKDYIEASSLNAADGDGLRISRQTFAIIPKIREVDHFISVERQNWLREVHPEVSFTIMADGACRHRKTTGPGWDERRSRLTAAGFPDPLEVLQHFHVPWGLRSDLADAMAAAWSASRMLDQLAVVLPSCPPPIDSRGLRMEIVA